MRKLTWLMLMSTGLLGCTSEGEPLSAIESMSQDTFAGKWYVLMNIENTLEKDKVASTTTYLKTGDNQFDDIYEYRDGGFDQPLEKLVGKAKSINQTNTLWQSTFFVVLRSQFEVLHLDSDHNTMLLGHKSRDLGWVFSRTPQATDEVYRKALSVFASNGYDTSKFLKVPQLPEQIGKSGFHTISN